MWALASAFIDIALHRSGPDRLPAERFLLILLIAIYFPVNFLRQYASGSATPLDFALIVADTLLFFAFVYAVLRFFRFESRFLQTACALLGTDVVINVIGVPIAGGGNATVAESGPTTLFSILYLVLFFWWIDVAGFIISRAIEQPYVVGIMFVIFYVTAMLSVLTAVTQAPG